MVLYSAKSCPLGRGNDSRTRFFDLRNHFLLVPERKNATANMLKDISDSSGKLSNSVHRHFAYSNLLGALVAPSVLVRPLCVEDHEI
eukprot:CAMPEP_0171903724 /NCGR_PEP_ID=MMETSP0993-20121228/3372_1 /TAXON_ID=483369 /ORGANISM="non described non described, Strain CCMP2098" /LENGTH=86 /DNA_ID=CAMNT_0012534189 /DNA_START=57 /DNA_END=314 /DNA_ORIENTATION=+